MPRGSAGTRAPVIRTDTGCGAAAAGAGSAAPRKSGATHRVTGVFLARWFVPESYSFGRSGFCAASWARIDAGIGCER